MRAKFIPGIAKAWARYEVQVPRGGCSSTLMDFCRTVIVPEIVRIRTFFFFIKLQDIMVSLER